MSGPPKEGTPNGVDRLAQIEALNPPHKHLPNEHGLVSRRDLLALVEIAKAAREIGRPGRSVSMEFPYLAERMDSLSAALARLDSGAAEENA